MLDKFVAFDVEMPGQASLRISAIGITVVENGKITKKIYSLINPETPFDPYVVGLIGITQEMVQNEPTFPEFWQEIEEVMSSGLLVAHGAGCDLRALAGCISHYGIKWLDKVQYVCTCDIGLACYPELEKHSLDALCEKIGFKLNHHNALSDSEGCAMLMLDYINKGVDIEKYICTFDVSKCHKVKKNRPRKKRTFEAKVQSALFSMANKGVKMQKAKRNPGIPPERIIGVKNAGLFQYAAGILKANKAPGFTCILPHTYLEENNLHAILISKRKKYSTCVSLIEEFLPFVESMETCDLIAPKIFKNCQPELAEQIIRWMEDESPFARALAINCAQRYFFSEEFVPSWLELVCEMDSSNKELNERRANFLALALVNFENVSLPYFENGKIDFQTHNKALQIAQLNKDISEEKKSFFASLMKS